MADDKEKDHLNDLLTEWSPTINMHVNKFKKAGLPPHIDHEDLHAAGMHGLIDALHKYSPNRGAKFSTYAASRIIGKMRDHITSGGDVNAVDYHHIKAAKDFTKKLRDKPQQSEPTPEVKPKVSPEE